MGRAPCCDHRMGLKKGPWGSEEDRILISYIQQHGHENWRSLPKQAGLLRCGKSCRLRWTNYLRPDIKRGNFSNEEEETIIQLHDTLGNRWSAIAAKLPGRTDNEIKNVWHTHLKKRVKYPNQQFLISTAKQDPNAPTESKHENPTESKHENLCSPNLDGIETPQQSTSEISSVTEISMLPNNISTNDEEMESFPEIDESFWSEELSTGNSNSQTDLLGFNDKLELQFPFSPAREIVNEYNVDIDDGMDFWYDLFIRAGGQSELPEL